jgi:Fe-S cluster assembly protein SufD
MTALNLALAQDGVVIEVSAGTVVPGFIHILHLGSAEDEPVMSHPHIVLVAGANSQVAVVETFAGSGVYFTNAVTEIAAADNALVDHTKIEYESLDAFHVGTVAVKQERSSSVTSRTFAMGGALVRNEIHAALAGEGATLALEGLFALSGTQHVDNHTVIDHRVPHCESFELFKGVLDQHSRGVFEGLIIVQPGAIKTNSRQVNRNLLLSETAIVDSKPTLEIYNDDVKCTHGSTIGQLDEEAMFYLRSRGIGEDDARSLLVHAFASEVVDRVRFDAVREQVRRVLFRAMPERLPERRGGAR